MKIQRNVDKRKDRERRNERKVTTGAVAIGLLVVSLASALTLDTDSGTWSNVVGAGGTDRGSNEVVLYSVEFRMRRKYNETS